MSTTLKMTSEKVIFPWRGFHPGLWQKEINVRDFIQQNYSPMKETTPSLRPPRSEPRRSGII